MIGIGGALSKAGVPTSGVAQVETAAVVGTITQSGNATFTVTAAGVSGSPVAVSVAVLVDDTATIVATKAAAAINANAAIAAVYTASSSTANLLLTRIRAAANDATLNIAYTNDTCAGLTPDASSNDTTAGVKGDWTGAAQGQYCLDTTNNDIYINTGTAYVPTWALA